MEKISTAAPLSLYLGDFTLLPTMMGKEGRKAVEQLSPPILRKIGVIPRVFRKECHPSFALPNFWLKNPQFI